MKKEQERHLRERRVCTARTREGPFETLTLAEGKDSSNHEKTEKTQAPRVNDSIPLHIRIIVKSLNAKCELLYHSQKLYVSTFSPFAESHSELRSELKLPLIFLNRLYLKENTDFPSSTQSHR